MTGMLACARNLTFTPRSGSSRNPTGSYEFAPLLDREGQVSISLRMPAKSTKNTIEVLLVLLYVHSSGV